MPKMGATWLGSMQRVLPQVALGLRSRKSGVTWGAHLSDKFLATVLMQWCIGGLNHHARPQPAFLL